MMSDPTPWTMTARWIFPADQPPLAGGVVTIGDDKIVAVEPADSRKADVDLGNAAILPGLVNAHTHLDLSGAAGACPPTNDFTQWLRQVIRFRGGRSLEEVEADIRAGLAECLSHGATLLGDVAASGSSWNALARESIRAIVFYELLGLPYERALASTAAAIFWLDEHEATPTCRAGLSPHAPYSVSAALLATAADLARRRKLPLAVHLAESPDELSLLGPDHRGPFVDFLKELGVWEPGELVASPEMVFDLCAPARPRLFVHGNYLTPPRRGRARSRHSSLVYCPRTHAAFGHPPHPFREFLKRGVRVVLGTDSLASNPDLDILAEARFVAARHPDLPGETLLRMITLDGAIALGWGDVTGSLTPGKSADLVALPLPEREEEDPYRLVFDSELAVQRVCFRGNWN
ncbi:MAG: amidohydrolase family protein [Gemmataceae bacterium]|nr:amidohydrolase family protein [Gemmataceae bacterium]